MRTENHEPPCLRYGGRDNAAGLTFGRKPDTGKIVPMKKKTAARIARLNIIRKILDPPADLSEFKEHPTPRLIFGLILMGFSYLMGWPAVAALSILAIRLHEPLVAVIGCPTTYGLSYVVFIVGAWFARAPHYLGVLARYAAQRLLRKLLC
ncbi:MAG: hypothetical protein PHY29_03460 [Syntrophales bacterium]|nr:hypothetical protein [Syntrophales bacterium]